VRSEKRQVTSRKAGLLASLPVFSFWSVYTSYVTIHFFDLATNMPFRELSSFGTTCASANLGSTMWYEKTLAGTQAFPYQWRMLGFALVRAVETISSLDPHLIDLAIKTVALAGSALLLFAFAGSLVSSTGAALATVTYLLVTAAAFVGAWAKETTLLIVFLVAFEAWRKRAPWSARDVHHRLSHSQPRLADRLSRAAPGLGLALACYVVLAWWVVVIRGLRHLLPFTILVLPLAVAEVEALLKDKQ